MDAANVCNKVNYKNLFLVEGIKQKWGTNKKNHSGFSKKIVSTGEVINALHGFWWGSQAEFQEAMQDIGSG